MVQVLLFFINPLHVIILSTITFIYDVVYLSVLSPLLLYNYVSVVLYYSSFLLCDNKLFTNNVHESVCRSLICLLIKP